MHRDTDPSQVRQEPSKLTHLKVNQNFPSIQELQLLGTKVQVMQGLSHFIHVEAVSKYP